MKPQAEPFARLFEALPDGIALQATSAFINLSSEYEQEEAYIAKAVDKRKKEFRTGRYTARRALKALGIPACAIPAGPNREPLWPAGVVGSISHCDTLCIAVVASSERYQSLGVDVEPNRPLPDDVRSMVFSYEEQHPGSEGIPEHLDTLTFSAKESVFKCAFPLTGYYFDFNEVSLIIDEENRSFTATLPERITHDASLKTVSGQYTITEEFVFTLAFIIND